MIKVSIVTASFNSGKTIRRTLESVASQSYQNIEHIIIDGASNDNTVEICKEFPHLEKIESEPDEGIYDAMNKGLQQANGDIIAILNSDDFFYDDDVLRDVVAAFLHNETIGIVYGNTLAGKFTDQGELEVLTRLVKPGDFNRSKFVTGWMPSHVSVYIRKEVYDNYGLFSTDFKIGADYELLLRFMYKERVSASYLNRLCVCFRVGGVSNSSLQNRILMLRESKEAWKMNGLRAGFLTPYLKILRGLLSLITTKSQQLLSNKSSLQSRY